jgi:hypothetical protein
MHIQPTAATMYDLHESLLRAAGEGRCNVEKFLLVLFTGR